MNKIAIMGTMTKDVQLKYIPSGVAVGNFNIAINQDYKNKDGQKIEKTSFFEVNVMGKQAEIINSYFRKGSRILIDGSLEQQRWVDNDGGKKSKVIIKLEGFTFVDKKSDNADANTQQREQPQQREQQEEIPEMDYDIDDSIPF